MRVVHLFSWKVIADMNMDAIHLHLTLLWIFSGCLVQFIAVSRHVRHQDYLPNPWKIFVIVSSLLLLGPTMIYIFCIVLILSFKLTRKSTPSTEAEVRRILDRALLFATRAKLAEIFFESVPQFLTQLAMTSAKGQEGMRELTQLQMASVVTSAITISLGVSKYVVDKGGEFFTKRHGKLTTRVILIVVVVTEIAFCGGISRFAFAFFYESLPLVAILMPLVTFSTCFVIAQMISPKFRLRFDEYVFLSHKACLWVALALISLLSQGSASRGVRALMNNNSHVTFAVTMTISFVVNVALGFLHRREKTKLKMYAKMDGNIAAIAAAMTERSAPAEQREKKVETHHDDIELVKVAPPAPTMASTKVESLVAASNDEECDIETRESSMADVFEEVFDGDIQESRPRTERSEEQNLPAEELPETLNVRCWSRITSYDATEATNANHTSLSSRDYRSNECIVEREKRTGRDSGGGDDADKENGGEKKNRERASPLNTCKTALEILCPLIAFLLLLGSLLAIMLTPIPYKEQAYHVEFHSNCWHNRGFPVVSSTKDSARGSICVKEKKPLDVMKIAVVVAEQLRLFPDPNAYPIEGQGIVEASTLLIGDLSYDGERSSNLKIPFLQPTCDGREGNLMRCTQYGLATGLSQSCYEGTKRLYISAFRVKVSQKWSPNHLFFVNETVMNFSDATQFCGEIKTFSQRCFQEEEVK